MKPGQARTKPDKKMGNETISETIKGVVTSVVVGAWVGVVGGVVGGVVEAARHASQKHRAGSGEVLGAMFVLALMVGMLMGGL